MPKTPARTVRFAIRIAMVAAPCAMLTMMLWASSVPALTNHPLLVMMVYNLLMVTSVGMFCVSILAKCHIAIHDAFKAGHLMGSQAVDLPAEWTSISQQRVGLRAVE